MELTTRRTAVMLVCAAMLAGCAAPRPVAIDWPGTEARVLPVTTPGEEQLPTDWGLSLSGGGVRAAMYGIGVLKALHEQGALRRIQTISSVSGGSYAAYWLITNQMAQANLAKQERQATQPLGEPALGARSFPRNACSLVTQGNFVTNWRYLSVLAGVNPVGMYQESLKRTFGASDSGFALHQLASATREQSIPLWIVNTTFRPLPTKDQTLRRGVVEMTPFMSGSVDLDYTRWESSGSLPVIQSVAISGAALALALKQSVRLPRPDGTTAAITLSDGGHTENLGAFALIRRRVKNIIVVDAEMDRSLGFGAYRKLKEGLAREGLKLEIPLIEARGGAPRDAVMKGTVTDTNDRERLVSTIYYVKMSLPPSTTRTWQNPVDLHVGEAGAKRVTDVLRASKGDDEDAPVKCETLDQEQHINAAEMLRHYVAKYSSFRAPYGDFPHFSTLDQSFYLDQSLAYLGLGYLQACELSTNPQLGLKEGLGLAHCQRLAGSQ